MPGSGIVTTSQASTVSFAGVQIGMLTNWRAIPGTAQFEDTTNITSQVIGTGLNARIVKQYDCTSVEPGGVDITLFGAPPFLTDDIGLQGELSVVFDGGSLTLDAYLESYDITASVGEVLVGTARFRFSGKAEE